MLVSVFAVLPYVDIVIAFHLYDALLIQPIRVAWEADCVCSHAHQGSPGSLDANYKIQ